MIYYKACWETAIQLDISQLGKVGIISVYALSFNNSQFVFCNQDIL